jgi:hypothetical protein
MAIFTMKHLLNRSLRSRHVHSSEGIYRNGRLAQHIKCAPTIEPALFAISYPSSCAKATLMFQICFPYSSAKLSLSSNVDRLCRSAPIAARTMRRLPTPTIGQSVVMLGLLRKDHRPFNNRPLYAQTGLLPLP